MLESKLSQKEQFFQKLIKKLKNQKIFTTVGEKFSKVCQRNVTTQIQDNIIVMPKKLGKKKLTLPKKPIAKEQQMLNESEILRMIEQEKQQALDKLRKIEKKQSDILIKKRAYSLRDQPKFKSNLTEDDKQKLKQLVQATRRYEKSLQKKTKQLNEMLLEKSHEEIKQHNIEIEKLRNERRQQVLKKLKSMQIRSNQKIKIYERSKELQRQINQRKYLYEENQEKEGQILYKKEKEDQKVMEKIKQRYKFDINQIKQHCKAYDKMIEQNRQKLQSNKSKLSSENALRHYPQNYYNQLVKNKMQEEKLQEYNRMNYGHQMKEKICKYQSYINKSFKPKISNHSKFVPSKQTASAVSLSNPDRIKKGMQYLQIAKKLKDKERERERRHTQLPPKNEPYKDYLKDLNLKQYETEEQQFKSIIRKGRSMSDYENASRAILLAERMDAKNKKLTDNRLLDSVKNKLDILNALE